MRNIFQIRVFSLAVWVILLMVSCQSGPVAEIAVKAGEKSKAISPVFFDVPEEFSAWENLVLENAQSGTQIPAQRIDGRAVFIPEQNLAAGEETVYHLRPAMAEKSFPEVEITQENGKISVHLGEKPVLSYQISTVMPADTLPAYYQRSGFIHPLYGPGGAVLSDDFPKGHTHQHAIFFAWVNAFWQGHKTDFWNQHHGEGTVRNSGVGETTSGPVFGRFTTRQEHLGIVEGDTTVILQETWEITVYALSDYFIWDITSRQECVTDSPLNVAQYHYGGMGFRGSEQWNPSAGEGFTADFLTSEGKTRADGNHTRPDWVAMSGTIDGKTEGFVVLDHKDNFRYPQFVRLHPDMPYFCFTPMVEEGFYIRKGGTYTSRYRVVTFSGAPDRGLLEGLAESYQEEMEIAINE
ncbi:MAG: PmoA family protein [Bacteroidia bacterium]|nr:PmoA family protein [Bacteroidia bacterium]